MVVDDIAPGGSASFLAYDCVALLTTLGERAFVDGLALCRGPSSTLGTFS